MVFVAVLPYISCERARDDARKPRRWNRLAFEATVHEQLAGCCGEMLSNHADQLYNKVHTAAQ